MTGDLVERLLRDLQAEIDRLDADDLKRVRELQKNMNENELVDRAMEQVRDQLGIDLTDPKVRKELAQMLKEMGIDIEKVRRNLS